jgi:hypothetical protein
VKKLNEEKLLYKVIPYGWDKDKEFKQDLSKIKI